MAAKPSWLGNRRLPKREPPQPVHGVTASVPMSPTSGHGSATWFRTTSTMTSTPAARQVATMQRNSSAVPERLLSIMETGMYFTCQEPPKTCSVTGMICTASKPLGPKYSTHSFATSLKFHSHSFTKTGLRSSWPWRPATPSWYSQYSLKTSAVPGSPLADASSESRLSQLHVWHFPGLYTKVSPAEPLSLSRQARLPSVSKPQ
mmetsp:Transcript_55485/g.161171  ORF Transcript_55485/g.161171 Transcript_55485/m.161171 type:complete len:204 (+) Transcript_55485:1256-1867(+)